MKRCRILLADDHAVVLEGLRRILDRPDFEIVGEARDGAAMLQAATELQPEVIIVDVTMPGMNGIEAARELRKSDHTTKFVFLSMHSEAAYARAALAVGASAYVLKSSAAEELVGAIDAVLHESPQAVETTDPQAVEKRERAGRVGLTRRQHEVLQLLAEGRSIKEVAMLLRLSSRTVEFHKYRVMETLGVRTVAELGAHAAKRGLIE
jgi:DNA-binding NarL/FixJ family response regulator